MIKIKNQYIFGTNEKQIANIDFIGAYFSPEFATPDRPDYSPEFWHLVIRHNNDAVIKADGQTYSTESEALTALDAFIISLGFTLP
jgi:hypothetical protein